MTVFAPYAIQINRFLRVTALNVRSRRASRTILQLVRIDDGLPEFFSLEVEEAEHLVDALQKLLREVKR